MKKSILALLIILPSVIYAQTENLNDSFPTLKKESFRYNEKLDNYLQPENNSQAAYSARINSYRHVQDANINPINLNLPPIDVYLGPPLESNTFTRNPFANDYSFYSGMVFSDNAWLSTHSRQNTYPTMGAVRSIGAQFNYRPASWLAVSAGPYGAKYNFAGQHFNDYGVSGAVKFIAHDRIRFNVYGQYSVDGKKNGLYGPMMNMYPQTYYGGTIEVKITNWFGIEGGVVRELNPINGKWENRTVIAPVFYTK
ncbi:hypothetical protein [Dysgonomonas sp. 511]|uniref:hypothetical protein n=1 Tax=Dysgonomonas sp. 511 TaxID=2302930 RepID=UPI0013D1912D|nr:hypothetical protein [Dysgonomonas sp. 511]NDV79054.1 hypothetical protein [Dysgonomonas sp. 511]